VATALSRGDEDEIVEINRWIESSPPEAAYLLEGLSRHESATVREWAASIAGRLSLPGSVDLLERLISDRSPIVQEVAIAELIRLDLARAAAVAIPRLRRQLLASDPLARQWALWRLVELGSRPDLTRLRAEGVVGAYDLDFAELVLDGRSDHVLDVLREHDHPRVLPAVRAALAMKTPAARQALEACAATAGDEECRRACRRVLEDHFTPTSR
jgi:hypothetical protein